MDKLTSLNLSFDRVLIQLVIPGLIAIFPWFIFFLNVHAHAKSYLHSNTNVTILAIIFLSLITGLIIENMGGRLEVWWLDKRNKKKYKNYGDIWDKFLLLVYEKNEPVGQRYLRNILLRMKFELSTAIAMIPLSIGLIFVNYNHSIFNDWLAFTFVVIVLPALFLIYLLYEATSSSEILAKTREHLVKEFYNVKAEASTDA